MAYDGRASRDVANGRIEAGVGDYPILAYNIAQGRFPQIRLVKSYEQSVVGSINIATKKGEAELMKAAAWRRS